VRLRKAPYLADDFFDDSLAALSASTMQRRFETALGEKLLMLVHSVRDTVRIQD
jgi:hypothetical protein